MSRWRCVDSQPKGCSRFPFGHLSIREHPRDEAILILRHLHDNPTPFTNIDASHITKIDLEGEPLEAVEDGVSGSYTRRFIVAAPTSPVSCITTRTYGGAVAGA